MKLVIFDLDGVIVTTDKYHYMAWKKLSDSNGWAFDEEVNHLLRGVSRKESLEIILKENNKSYSEEKISEFLTYKNDIYKNSLGALSPSDILPGVENLISSLKEDNIRIAVGSSSSNTQFILKKIGLTNSFDAVVDGTQISNSKPDPEVFLKCADKLEIPPIECVVLEDAQAGIDAALRAEMVAVGIGEASLERAHRIFRDLKDITCADLKKVYELAAR